MTTAAEDVLLLSVRTHLRAGLALIVAVAGGVGGWAAATEIAGAVIAVGQVVVESNVKRVQHATGGIVAALNVRDGDEVESGQVVISLDDTSTRAGLAIVVKSLTEQTGRKARLQAERDGVTAIAFPGELTERTGEAAVIAAAAMEGEARLFALRRVARQGQIDQLNERVGQVGEEIRSLAQQANAKASEIVLIKKELGGARQLWARNLMSITKMTALERDATRLEGEHGALLASIARAKSRITEIQQQIFQIDRDFASEVALELASVDAKIGELVERRIAAEAQLQRIDIHAPQAGKVHQLSVHTVGGVVTAGETLMQIVPRADVLVVDARVLPGDIDQVRPGQTARLRFTAFNQRTTPEIAGTVARISADVVSDPRSFAGYFTVRITPDAAALSRPDRMRIVPGMPVEVYIESQPRVVLSYLVKPLSDQLGRAMREK